MGGRAMLMLRVLLATLACLSVAFVVKAEDPYRYFTWTVTYGTISPLGVPQQGILINGLFPGPRIDAVTNDNVIVNVINKLDQPFLITWNGIKHRKTSWQDGVLGTNCPIPPNTSYQYRLQVKDQFGTFTYFPSTKMHKASGGFGAFNIYTRPKIPLPFATPANDFTFLVGDWYKAGHKELEQILDTQTFIPFPNGVLINGLKNGSEVVGDQGQTYMFRISNVGITYSINFRIQGHKMKLVEIEGSHTVQELYDSLDVHVGQSLAVLVTLNQPPKDYYIVASSRFTGIILTSTAILHYSNSRAKASGFLPSGPEDQINWSLKQARTFRWNLSASAARPNPQGSFHYGNIPITRTVVLGNKRTLLDGKLRFAVNSVSYVNPETPLKLADYFNIPGVFDLKTIKNKPGKTAVPKFGTSVVDFALHDFIELVFQNNEDYVQSWHLDGNDFFVVGYGPKTWSNDSRKSYNLIDAPTRYTIQVYPRSWSAVLLPLDNKGMWNLRSASWPRRYLGQELYFRVWNDEKSLFTEYDIPANALRCGKAKGR